MSRQVAEIVNGPRVGTTPRTATRYYEIRCRTEPYDVSMPLVVEAPDLNEVHKKYPDAEFVGVLGEHQSPGSHMARPPAVAQPGNIQVISRPLGTGWQKSTTHQSTPGKCGICGRTRLSRAQYAWRRANGLATWRCQHRRPTRRSSHDLVQAMVLIAILAVYALAVAL